ncbi:MAG: 1-acyl-sn-glycerol-3-phosphate acyltransferase [Clostridia bacterium]|nr:1-acyl-sn-glycerol-3-phosphate acyltransferase [Clostridia bacterium]
MSVRREKPSILYKVLKSVVKFVYKKYTIEGFEHLPEQPSILVGNHSQLHGPLACELYLPHKRYTWCAGEMMRLKEVPAYAFKDFWSQKPKYTHWYYKCASYAIAPLASFLFNNAKTISVDRDARIVSTFKKTVKKLCEGNHIVIFPEHDVKHNHIVYDFQTNFVDVARLYYKKTGVALQFVPMYLSPNLKKIVFGEPIAFHPENEKEQERKRICDCMMSQITELAQSLPRHKVVPYRNIPKKLYPYNRVEKE